jgi:nucleoside-diphosphate-sugar epimerase
MRVVVTGAAGMIGSNIAHGLNAAGVDDIIAVDDLRDGQKFRNLLGVAISDYFDRTSFTDVSSAANWAAFRRCSIRAHVQTPWNMTVA